MGDAGATLDVSEQEDVVSGAVCSRDITVKTLCEGRARARSSELQSVPDM